MDRATFFKHFELLADQPDAVAKMRELVLDLAIRGKVSDQLNNDEVFEIPKPPNDEGNNLESPQEDQQPFKIPSNWCWMRFGQLFDIQGGTQPPKSTFIDTPTKGYVRLLQIRDLGPKPVPTYVPASDKLHRCKSEDVMLARYGASVGKIFMGQDGAYNVALTKVVFDHSAIFNRFVFWLFQTSLFQACMTGMSRSAQAGFNKGDLFPIAIPMPPLAEQKRIVAKVDELMALCDELEKRRQARQQGRAQLQQSALHHLLAARELQSFAVAWKRVKDHFHPLHETPDSIPQLRQAILQLAVQGRLIQQDPMDEPVSELLAYIRQQKTRLIECGKIQKEKPLKDRNGEAAFFTIPQTWQWTRLSDLTELITKGSSPKWQGISYVTKDEGVLFITSENVGTYCLRKLDDLKYVEKRFNQIEPRSMLRFGDILMNLVGASIGRTAIYNLRVEANINQAVALIRLMPGITDGFTGFLLHYLNSPSAIQHMLASQVVNAQPNISLTDARDFPVPVPPLAEQKRIVARVEELMRCCDKLETQLNQSRILGSQLLESTLHQLLAA